jgi:hypothetical protein
VLVGELYTPASYSVSVRGRRFEFNGRIDEQTEITSAERCSIFAAKNGINSLGLFFFYS